MFVLVDSLNIELNDRPNLGCAMLLGACKKENIPTTFLNGSAQFISELLTIFAEDYYHLFSDYQKNLAYHSAYMDNLLAQGKDKFLSELYQLNDQFFVNKNLRAYLCNEDVNRIVETIRYFDNFHDQYLKNETNVQLPLVSHYTNEILSHNPDVIGFSMKGFDSISRAVRQEIKKIKSIPMIVGGWFTPFLEKNEIEQAFEEQFVDYMIVGPGDLALPRLIHSLSSCENKNFDGIDNLIYRRSDEIQINPQRIVSDLDQLPKPDFEPFLLKNYFSPFIVLSIQTARGCSYQKCAFCSYHQNSFGSCKMFNLDKVMEIIKEFSVKYSCHHFYLHDDDFPAARAKRFCEKIIQQDIQDIYFYQYARLDPEYNNDQLINLLYQAGFSFIHWGLESGSQAVLDLMNKNVRVKDMGQILKKCSRRKIGSLCTAIIGFPGETKRFADETVKFLKRNANYIDILRINLFELNKQSLVYSNPERWQIAIHKDGSYQCEVGMEISESEKYLTRLLQRFVSDQIKLASPHFSFIKYPPKYYLSRIMAIYFRNRLTKPGETSPHSYPVILGKVVSENNHYFYCPIRTDKTEAFNKTRYLKKIKCNELFADLYDQADGSKSVEQIVQSLTQKYANQAEIQNMVLKYLTRIAHKKWGMVLHGQG